MLTRNERDVALMIATMKGGTVRKYTTPAGHDVYRLLDKDGNPKRNIQQKTFNALINKGFMDKHLHIIAYLSKGKRKRIYLHGKPKITDKMKEKMFQKKNQANE